MKKILFVLIMLLAVGMLSAATSVTLNSSTRTGEATLEVVLPLKSGNFEYITVGFTDSKVAEATTENFDVVTPFASEKVKLNSDGDNTASYTTDLYAYWQIRTEDTVTVTLSKDKALTGTNPANKINWKIAANSLTQDMTDYDTTNAITLVNAWTKDVSNTINQGSAQITIDTENYSGKPTDDYSANLVLKVTAAG